MTNKNYVDRVLNQLVKASLLGSLIYAGIVSPTISQSNEPGWNHSQEGRETLESLARSQWEKHYPSEKQVMSKVVPFHIPETPERTSPTKEDPIKELLFQHYQVQEPKQIASLPKPKTNSYELEKQRIEAYIEQQQFYKSPPNKKYAPTEILKEGTALASFYLPGDSRGEGGPDITATGLTISKAIKAGIPIVAGSCRLGTEGDALYELTNPKNGKTAVVFVTDKFDRKTLRDYPERIVDIVSNSEIPEKLGFKGDPKDPYSFGVQEVQFKYIGKIGD